MSLSVALINSSDASAPKNLQVVVFIVMEGKSSTLMTTGPEEYQQLPPESH